MKHLTNGAELQVRRSFALDPHDSMLGARYHSLYDVSPDGERFLVNERLAAPPTGEARLVPGAPRAATIAVVVDWMADLVR